MVEIWDIYQKCVLCVETKESIAGLFYLHDIYLLFNLILLIFPLVILIVNVLLVLLIKLSLLQSGLTHRSLLVQNHLLLAHTTRITHLKNRLHSALPHKTCFYPFVIVDRHILPRGKKYYTQM